MSRKKIFASRTPVSVKGGIRAQLPHGGHVRTWWSRRWLEMLEGFRLGARLGRGRSYAVSGQVSSLTILPGEVTAAVQGADRSPYQSTIRFQTLAESNKQLLIETLRRQPMTLARLLVGDLPFEVETLFRDQGCPLFPRREKDVTSRCSCPDYANPCKHLAAVYCLLGEAISRKPLLLLELRGVCASDLFEAEHEEPAPKPADAETQTPPPLTREAFYGAAQEAFNDFGAAHHAATSAPLIYRLGPLPFWRGQERFTNTMEHLFARAATRGWTVWTGEPLDLRREDEKVIIKGASLHLKHRKMRVDTSWSS